MQLNTKEVCQRTIYDPGVGVNYCQRRNSYYARVCTKRASFYHPSASFRVRFFVVFIDDPRLLSRPVFQQRKVEGKFDFGSVLRVHQDSQLVRPDLELAVDLQLSPSGFGQIRAGEEEPKRPSFRVQARVGLDMRHGAASSQVVAAPFVEVVHEIFLAAVVLAVVGEVAAGNVAFKGRPDVAYGRKNHAHLLALNLRLTMIYEATNQLTIRSVSA
ncbi:hypothetical protein L596_023581 [Steinernema carpocapsae]|uniref:Uncharacterized protein n=1 Tax=Steinernema carpocapsae TaxID=34508 RepID=A0A4U5ME30_STECR|nr:hypothetical protein L596_023581 [Steinernema carpocapsae]